MNSKIIIGGAVLLVGVLAGWFFFASSSQPAAPLTPPAPSPLGSVPVDDNVYVGFRIDSDERRAFILDKVGPGNTAGRHRLAVPAHLNPLGNLYTKPDYPFEIDRAKLDEKKSYGLPMTLGIFAGKFFTSRVTDYLEKDENNLMFDQFDRPILLDRVGGTYFAISPGAPGLPENESSFTRENFYAAVKRFLAE